MATITPYTLKNENFWPDDVYTTDLKYSYAQLRMLVRITNSDIIEVLTDHRGD